MDVEGDKTFRSLRHHEKEGSAPGSSSAADTVGRGEQSRKVFGALEDLMAGRGGVVWVEGEPGIGKTTLADMMIKRASSLGSATFRGAAAELMAPCPLRLMADCLGVSIRSPDPARVEIAGLMRGEAGPSGVADAMLAAAAERMIELVERQCADRPVLVVTDDLQWADEPSLMMWNRLARVAQRLPLLLVGISRLVPGNRPVTRLRSVVHAQAAPIIHLGPLGEPEVARLAEGMIDGVPGPRLCDELARAGGNPLYLRLLIEALVGDRLIRTDGGVAEYHGTPGTTPATLAGIVRHHLDFLSDTTCKVLQMAALIDREFDAAGLAAIAGVSPTALAEAVTEAVGCGLLESADGRLAFRHPLIRQVLAGQTSASMLPALHRHIARVLAESGGGVDAVGRHLRTFVHSGLDDWVLDWLVEIDVPSLARAAHVSAPLLAEACAISETDERWELLVKRLIMVLIWRGRDEEVIEFAAKAEAAAVNVDLVAWLRSRTVSAARRLGRFENSLAQVAGTLKSGRLPLAWRARFEAASAISLVELGRADEARSASQRALTAAFDSADPLSIAYARRAAALVAPVEEALEHIEQALLVVGNDAESMDLRLQLTRDQLARLRQLDRQREHGIALSRALALAERAGTISAAGIVAGAIEHCYLHGDWDGALAHLAGLDPEFLANPYLANLHGLGALIALHRGQREQAVSHLAAVDGPVSRRVACLGLQTDYVAAARALLAEADGDLRKASALGASWLEEGLGVRGSAYDHEAPELVRRALAAGDRDTAQAAALVVHAAARAEPLIHTLAAARLCQAQLDDDIDQLLTLADDYGRRGRPRHQGLVWEEAAVRLAAAGDTARARRTLAEAVDRYSTLGADWDIARAEARLRALGVRRGPRSTHRRETTGWGALTPQELKIASLIGQGWSNPDIAAKLFLSRRTVQTHVSNILAKLQLHSRVEVQQVIAERG